MAYYFAYLTLVNLKLIILGVIAFTAIAPALSVNLYNREYFMDCRSISESS